MMPLTPVTLTGRWVQLEPLEEKHAVDLFAVGQNEEIWQYLTAPMPRDIGEMRAWVNDALAKQARGEALPFVIVERATGKIIGSTRYLDISLEHRHVEIGWTWLGRDYWRTPVNTECKYLLLKHAFETLNCIRVQLKTDVRNTNSQRAIERIGGVREGVLRKAVIIKDGYQRSSVYYSLLDDEWLQVKARLEERLYATNPVQ
jgi:RimJ/RimL family protein N-acetyltransferase